MGGYRRGSLPAWHRFTTAVAAVAGAVILGSVLTACGGSGTASSHVAKSTTTSRPARSTTTAPASGRATTKAADAALAKAKLLPASAFPAGWQGQGPQSTNTQASFFGGLSQSEVAQLASCLGMPTAGIDPNPAEAADQEYDDPNSALSVTDSVEVYPTAAAAKTDVEAAANGKAPTCLLHLFAARITKTVPKGMTLGTPASTAVSIPAYGSHDAALMATIPFRYQGLSGTLHIEDLAVQQGRTEAVLEFMDSVDPPTAVVDPLVAAAAARLQGKQA